MFAFNIVEYHMCTFHQMTAIQAGQKNR